MSRPSPTRGFPPPRTRTKARPTSYATSPSISSPYSPRMSYALKIDKRWAGYAAYAGRNPLWRARHAAQRRAPEAADGDRRAADPLARDLDLRGAGVRRLPAADRPSRRG